LVSVTTLHLPASIGSALARLGWDPADPLAHDAVPTVARGHNLVAVVPPSPAYAGPVLAGVLAWLSTGKQGLLLAPPAQLAEWGRLAIRLGEGSAVRIEIAHGSGRVLRRIREQTVDLVIAAPETALALQRRSALPLETLASLILAWPESWEDEESIAPLMQDFPREAQRIVVTAAADRAGDLVERYARRALAVGAPADAPSPAPLRPVRTASTAWTGRVPTLADLAELMDPASLVIWTADRLHHEDIREAIAGAEPGVRVVTGDAPKAALVIAFDLPTPERLRQLLGAGEVVLLVPPGTEAYAGRIASPLRPIRLPGAADSVTSTAGMRRAAIVRALAEGGQERALLTLAPLFERYDPAAVAAALFELWIAAGAAVPSPIPDIPATSRIYVGIGKKDGATVNDLVAVLTKEVRLAREKIGRVELREGFALVEVPAQEAERVTAALNGVTLRRKRVTARLDRGATKPSRAARPGSRR
jgi:ATP-dependent RNA helicase DeaD